jgi:hypothetical protein
VQDTLCRVRKTLRHHDGRFAKLGEVVSAQAAHAAKQAELATREARGSSHEGGAMPWRAGLDRLPPEARAAMAAVSAEKDAPDVFDIDRMLTGLGAAQEIADERE